MQNREFNLHFSKCHAAFAAIVIGASLLIVALLPINYWVRTILFIATSLYGVWLYWHSIFLSSKNSIIAIRHLSDDQWVIRTKEVTYQASLLGDSLVTAWVCVLRFRVPERYRALSCVVVRDSLESEAYRRLIVLIKHS